MPKVGPSSFRVVMVQVIDHGHARIHLASAVTSGYGDTVHPLSDCRIIQVLLW